MIEQEAGELSVFWAPHQVVGGANRGQRGNPWMLTGSTPKSLTLEVEIL